MDNEPRVIGRRGLVAGGAALGTAAVLGTAGAAQADAAAPPIVPRPGRAVLGATGDPGGPRVGSAPIGGYSYVHLTWPDFQHQFGGDRQLQPLGAYADPPNYLVATADLPPGAVLRDIEWYLSATTSILLYAYLWTSATIGVTLVAETVPAAGAGIRAVRTVVPENNSGPYAMGSKLLLFAYTSVDRTINGARIGLSSAPAGTVLLPTPTRVYDSRSGAKIGNGQTRIHSLASYVPAGATAAMLNVSITSGEKSGGLAAYNTGSPLPSGSLLYWNGGTTVSNEIHVKLPSDRKIKVTSRGVTGCKAHYFIDLVGYTA